MQKQAPTLGRLLVMVGFALSCFGLLLFLWLAFGGAVPLKPKGYRFETTFREATQLAIEADVRISGVPVGRVKTIEPDRRSGRSVAVIEIEERFAPIPADSKATLRQKTLLGETYVELTPGTPGSRMLPEEGRLRAAQVSETVELDEILRAFDPRTRQAFQTWVQNQSVALRDRGLDINDTLGTLEPFAEDTGRLLRVLNGQDAALRRTVRNTGEVFDALSERRGQLAAAIRNGNRVFTTTAQRDEELRRLFTVLPTFNTEAEQTVRRLDRFARETDPLVSQLRPAARELGPTFTELEGLAPDLRALFTDLDPLITASERGLPATERFLGRLAPALGEFDPTLKQLNPILSFLGEYRRELSAFFSGSAAATQANEGGVHYLRTLNPQTPENLAAYPRRIGANRNNAYRKPGGFRELDTPQGPASYETRHCANGNPDLTPSNAELATQLQGTIGRILSTDPATGAEGARRQAEELAANIRTFAFANAGRRVPAPPCRNQGPFRLAEGRIVEQGGQLSQYPQVRAARSSTSRP